MKGWMIRALLVGIPILTILTIYFAPYVAAFIYEIIAAFAPIWLPVVLAVIAWPLWLTFIRSLYVSRIEYATLELKPGDNTPKTAKPMELIFYALYHRTEVNRFNALVNGIVRVPWSFEIAASAGIVRFFLHVPVHHRSAVESRIRAEYRDIDIDEVRDYSREDKFDPFSERIAMREYTLAKADPYPLKTYEAHEHAKDRHDVFGELLNELGAVPEGQSMWVSLMVRPHQRDWGNGFWDFIDPPIDSLHEDARSEIQKIVGKSGDVRGLPAGKQKVIEAIERALQKPSFDCGLRVLYRAPRETWDESRAQSLDHLFDRFGDSELNSFESYDPRALVGWPLSDIFAAFPVLDDEYFLKLYRRRAFFSPPYYGKSFVLNTEELATLWHLPKIGRSSALSRSRGARLEPPENLPV